MITVAPSHYSAMDLLRADDHMDLASSPVMAASDVDFELDDVPGILAEPNQDTMLQDDPLQPIVESLSTGPAINNLADDDAMLDEDTLIQQDENTNISDLNMDNNDGTVHAQEDDDILYEEEEGFLEDEGQIEGQHSTEENKNKCTKPLDGNQAFKEPHSDLDEVIEIDLSSSENVTNPQATAEEAAQSGTVPVILEDTAVEITGASEAHGSKPPLIPDPDPGWPTRSLANDGAGDDLYEVSIQADLEATRESETEHDEIGLEFNALQTDQEAKIHPPISEVRPNVSQGDKAVRTTDYDEEVSEGLALTPLHHTVKVHYLEAEMCLFPPTENDDSEMYFLQDVSLAHGALDKMLGACREVLADTIGQDDELVLDVASLGLHISEGSRYAAQITLSQIVDVYLGLAHNDNISSIEPLYCSLTSRVCLASQYAYLKAAADEGKTLTQILEESAFPIDESEEGGLDHEKVENLFQEPQTAALATNEGSQGDAQDDMTATLEEQPDVADPDAQTESTTVNDNQQPQDEFLEEPRTGSTQHVERPPAKAAAKDGEQSPTTTVKACSEEIEGDYDPFLDDCLTPGATSCPSFANIYTDTSVTKAHREEDIEDMEDMFGDAADVSNGGHITKSNLPADPNDPDRPDIESNVQDSVSSRTLDADHYQLEEGFTQDIDNGFAVTSSENAASQQIDEEDFELEDEGGEIIVLKGDGRPTVEANHETAFEDLGEDLVADESALDLGDDMGTVNPNHEYNQNVGHDEGDDDLLNFDEDDFEGEDRENNAEPAIVNSAYVSVISGNATDSGDASDLTGHIYPGASAQFLEKSDQQNSLVSSTNASHSTGPTLKESPNQPSTESVADAPNTPPSGKSGNKRKALEEDDELDFLDLLTPDKKKRRPS